MIYLGLPLLLYEKIESFFISKNKQEEILRTETKIDIEVENLSSVSENVNSKEDKDLDVKDEIVNGDSFRK